MKYLLLDVKQATNNQLTYSVWLNKIFKSLHTNMLNLAFFFFIKVYIKIHLTYMLMSLYCSNKLTKLHVIFVSKTKMLAIAISFTRIIDWTFNICHYFMPCSIFHSNMVSSGLILSKNDLWFWKKNNSIYNVGILVNICQILHYTGIINKTKNRYPFQFYFDGISDCWNKK